MATISRLLQITGLFCKRALEKRLYSANETYNLKEPTDRRHPIVGTRVFFRSRHTCVGVGTRVLSRSRRSWVVVGTRVLSLNTSGYIASRHHESPIQDPVAGARVLPL